MRSLHEEAAKYVIAQTSNSAPIPIAVERDFPEP